MMEEITEDSNGESTFEFIGSASKGTTVSDHSSSSVSQARSQFISSKSDSLSKIVDSTADLKLDSASSPPSKILPPAALPAFNVDPSQMVVNSEYPPQDSGHIQSYFSSSSAPFLPPQPSSSNMFPRAYPRSSVPPIMSAVANESAIKPNATTLPPQVSTDKHPPATVPPFVSPQLQSSVVTPPPILQSPVNATPQAGPPLVSQPFPPQISQIFTSTVESEMSSNLPQSSTLPTVSCPPASSFNQGSAKYFQPTEVTQFSPAVPPPNILSQPHQSNLPNAAYDLTGTYITSTSVDQPDSESGKGLFTWIKDSVKGNEFLHKFAEKAKSSVDTVIYTLDPQMKDFMNASEEINLVVASDKEVKVGPIRQSFKTAFIQASVVGVASYANIAEQPVGYTAALKGAEERILNLRQREVIHPHQPVVAIEGFLLEATPDNWFAMDCLLLQDPKHGLTLKSFTQATPVPPNFVLQAQDFTPNDYPLRWSGFAMSIGQIIGSAMNVHHTEWREALVGVSRQEMILLAAKVLAGQYKVHVNKLMPHQTMNL